MINSSRQIMSRKHICPETIYLWKMKLICSESTQSPKRHHSFEFRKNNQNSTQNDHGGYLCSNQQFADLVWKMASKHVLCKLLCFSGQSHFSLNHGLTCLWCTCHPWFLHLYISALKLFHDSGLVDEVFLEFDVIWCNIDCCKHYWWFYLNQESILLRKASELMHRRKETRLCPLLNKWHLEMKSNKI